ncbi:hypothetical protein ACFV0T_41240 [Streptomyces sp. NPDC059582]|uniref:hypothetical protein n=1 Tax=Streptomyces sp. NPDC059582 TaxID=3346875 RepID=UPI0036752CC7
MNGRRLNFELSKLEGDSTTTAPESLPLRPSASPDLLRAMVRLVRSKPSATGAPH